jgi:uncharacterized protein YbjT (DUF2867 family)
MGHRLFGPDDPQLQSVRANIHDERSVADALAGAYGVVNAASLYVEHGQETFQSTHVESAQRVGAQALRAGVDRLIHISGIGADTASQSRYIRKRGEGELAVRGRLRQCTFRPPGGDVRTGRRVSHHHPQATSPASNLSDVRPRPTRLQLAYVGDVAEAVARVIRRAETHSTIFEFGGPRVYSYEEFLGAVAHQAGLAPRLIPIPFAVWHALAWASEMFPSPLLTRDQVELLQIDTGSLDLLKLGFHRTRSRQYSRTCCRIADERGSPVDPLQRLKGAHGIHGTERRPRRRPDVQGRATSNG